MEMIVVWWQLSWAFDDHGLGDAVGAVEGAVRTSLAHTTATLMAVLHDILRQQRLDTLSKAKHDAFAAGGLALAENLRGTLATARGLLASTSTQPTTRINAASSTAPSDEQVRADRGD
jgi:hypothetical protein